MSLPELPPISKKKLKSVKNILKTTKKKDDSSLVTADQAEILADLRFAESKELILTLEHIYFLYEIIWMLSKEEIGYESVYNFLTTDWEKILGRHNIRKKMLFENPLLGSAREKFAVDMEIYRNKVDVEEGGEDCPKCRSSSTVSVEQYKRRADEAAIITVYCTECKYKWNAQ